MSNFLVIGALDAGKQMRHWKSAESRRSAPQWDEQDERMDRFITKDEITDLANVLLGTDDSLSLGLSQIGIDPDTIGPADRKLIREWLKEREGVRFTESSGWVRDGETPSV